MIDCHNNVSERLARRFKTGLRAQVSFREGTESQVHNRSTMYRCDCLSFIEITKMQGRDVWKQVREVFRGPMPKKRILLRQYDFCERSEANPVDAECSPIDTG